MKASLPLDSNKKKPATGNPPPEHKTGKVFRKELYRRIKYIVNVEKRHWIDGEPKTLRNVFRTVHNLPLDCEVRPITAGINSPVFAKQVEANAQDITKAFIKWNEDAHKYGGKSRKKAPVEVYEFESSIRFDEFSWIDSEEEMALYQLVAAEETLQYLTESCGGLDRMYVINVHNEKEIEVDETNFPQHLSNKVRHNLHCHVNFAAKSGDGVTFNVPQYNLVLEEANARVMKGFEYRFKLVKDEYGKPMKGADGLFLKEHILDLHGNKIPFVSQDNRAVKKLNQKAKVETYYKKGFNEFGSEIMESFKDKDIVNLNELNAHLSKLGLKAYYTTKKKGKNPRFDQVIITSPDNEDLKLEHWYFEKDLKIALDRLGQQSFYEHSNDISIRDVRQRVDKVLDKVKSKPSLSYHDLCRTLENEGLRLKPRIKKKKDTGEEYVESGVLQILDKNIHMKLSWLPNFGWMTIQQLLALEEEMLLEEIKAEEAMIAELKSQQMQLGGFITRGNKNVNAIERRLNFQIDIFGNQAVRSFNNNIEVFTEDSESGVLSTTKTTVNVAEIMLGHIVTRNKEKIEAGETVIVDVMPSGNKGMEWCRNSWVASQILEIQVEMNFINGYNPETDPLVQERLAEEKKRVMERMNKGAESLYKRIVKDQPDVQKRRVAVMEHWNIPEVKYISLSRAITHNIYSFKNYSTEDILNDKDKILAVTEDQHQGVLKKYFDDIERELNGNKEDNKLKDTLKGLNNKYKRKP